MRVRALCLLLGVLAACGEGEPPRLVSPPPPPLPPQPPSAPERVAYDQILIAFRGSYRRGEVFRTQEEARQLAESLLDRANSGVDFRALKREYSDDRDPTTGAALGPYVAVRPWITPMPPDEITPHVGIGEVVFRLKPGEVGLATYDPRRCPEGWFVLLRLR